ncbi:hypothetical protein SAMN05414139_02333 [Burkholderia sp. D7]|nr:hypothetical protein SAMN05414139_02333 [Burkholderia sp. D7]
MTFLMLINVDIEANYFNQDGTLGLGAWIGLVSNVYRRRPPRWLLPFAMSKKRSVKLALGG